TLSRTIVYYEMVTVVDGRVGKAASDRRRRSIIEAALECFTTDGYEPTTVSDLRRRAHVTAGSLYHYFPGGKAEIAATVHLDCLRRYQEEFLPVLAAAGDDPEAGIRVGVRHHLEWIIAHPQRARFLFSDHPQEVAVARRESLGELNAAFFAAVGRWIDRHITAGAIRPLPKQALYALWVGPAQHVGRQLVTDQLRLPLEDTIDVLSEGAWRALRADTSPASA
ncbi:MAG TPA: TetR/AcrR family transcriptional regulator, partial [Jiangellaceae bacterium]|nr:TetR/AcrR family transcriptional regulator [Jiangellaceae bacterium]